MTPTTSSQQESQVQIPSISNPVEEQGYIRDEPEGPNPRDLELVSADQQTRQEPGHFNAASFSNTPLPGPAAVSKYEEGP